jgi:hypothetical protein
MLVGCFMKLNGNKITAAVVNGWVFSIQQHFTVDPAGVTSRSNSAHHSTASSRSMLFLLNHRQTQ